MLAGDHDALADHPAVGAEAVDPERVADHHQIVVSGLFVIGDEEPADFGPQAEQGEEVARDEAADDADRIAAGREDASGASDERQGIERLR